MKIRITTDNDEVVYEYQTSSIVDPYSVIGGQIRNAMKEATARDVENARNARNAERWSSCWKEVAPKTAKRVEHGCDFGATGEILLERGPIYLVWRKGSMQWSGRGSQSYYPAELQLFDANKKGDWAKHTTLQEGGRLTKKLIEQHAERLRKAFGVAELPDIKKGATYVYKETVS